MGVLRDHLPEEVRTERLLLRRPRPDDGDALFAIEGDPRTAAHRPDGPRTRDGSDADLARYLRDWDEELLGYWFVELDGAHGPRLTRQTGAQPGVFTGLCVRSPGQVSASSRRLRRAAREQPVPDRDVRRKLSSLHVFTAQHLHSASGGGGR